MSARSPTPGHGRGRASIRRQHTCRRPTTGSLEIRVSNTVRWLSPRHDNQRHQQQNQPDDAVNRNPAKTRTSGSTGDEPMTGPQQSYLGTLAQEAGTEVLTT
jgi:hypothetical protein